MFKLLIPLLLIISTSQLLAQHYVKDTGRQPDKIESVFPYDIAIRTAENDTLNTEQIFKKNDRPTVLLFWLTTCAPCRAEMSAISKKYASWQAEKAFNMYAVSVDWPRNEQRFASMVKQHNWPFPAYHDINREFGKIMPGHLNGLPQVFVLNGEGEIVHHKRKYRPGDEDQLFEVVKNLD
ncbi:MAG: TlpA disulfide reductase family protein [Bacteroidota bacterium]